MFRVAEKKFVSKRRLLIASGIFLVYMIAMNIGAARLDGTILDFRIGYTSADAFLFFEQLGISGRETYQVLLFFDFVFPITYMYFGLCLSSFLIQKQKDFKEWQRFFILLPVLAMVCDWIENILILVMLHSYSNTFLNLGGVTSTVTIVKFASLGIFLLWIAFLTIKILHNRSKNA